MKYIIATPYRKRPHKPRRYAFLTTQQWEVEHAMLELGYGCSDYNLWSGEMTDLPAGENLLPTEKDSA